MLNQITFKKLSTSLVLAASLVVIQLPTSLDAHASGAEAQQEKKKRPTKLMSPTVGKKVQKAFELYTADDIKGALALLLEIKTSKEFDKVTVSRYIAIMYVTLGDNEKKAIEYIKAAVEPDILNEQDQGTALKLLADLQMQIKDYKGALVTYKTWMDFTGKDDAMTWTKIANAYYALKQLDKMIVPADRAIVAFGDKHNANPYILKMTSYYERKMYHKAIDVLETVIQIFPEDKQWWTRLGMFYLLVEDYNKAVQTLELAYKQGFLQKESEIKTLANLYSSSGMPYKAAKLLEKHIDSGLVKRDDKNISTLANAWHAALEIKEAAKYYGELAKMTNDAQYYRKQGMLLKQDEKFSGAIIALNKALELGVKNQGRMYMSIAESYFYLEKYKQAYVAINKAMEDPKSRKSAKGWKSFIIDTAKRKNVAI